MIGFMGKYARVTAMSAVVIAVTAAPAHAEQQLYYFDLPSQELGSALKTVARIAHQQVAFDEEAVRGKRAPALKGSFSARDAIDKLIDGAQLTVETGRSGLLILRPQSVASAGHVVGSTVGQGPMPIAAPDAPETPPRDIIVTGVNSRLPAQLSSFPGSVTVVGREEVATQSAINTDVGAMLAYEVPGLATGSFSASDANQGLRGRPLSYFVDGVPISVPLRDGGRSQRAVPLSALAGIEVIRGATALYGNGGNGGSVNYITKRPDGPDGITGISDISLGMSLSHPGDSFNPRMSQDFTVKSGGFDLIFSGAYEKKSGYFDAQGDRIASDPTGNGGISDSNIYNLFTKAGFTFGANRIEAGLIYYSQEQDTDYGLQILGNQQLGIKTQAKFGQLDPRAVPEYNHNLIAQASYINNAVFGGTMRIQGYHQQIQQRFSFNATRAGGTQSRILSNLDGLRLDLRTPLSGLGLGNGDLLWGAEYARDRVVQDVNTVPVRVFVPRIDQKNYSAFGQIEIKPFSGFSLQGGARFDVFDVLVDDFTVLTTGLNVKGGKVDYNSFVFNVGASQRVIGALTIYAGFSQGFSLPDIGLQIRATTAVNPLVALRPQPIKVDNYEAGIRGKFGGFDFTLAGFLSTSKLGQTFTPCPDDPFINCVTRAAERIYGVEATIGGHLLDRRLRWGGTVSLVKGDQDTNGDGKVDTPLPNNRVGPIKMTGYASYMIDSGWSVRLQGVYSGDRNAFPAIASTSTGPNGHIRPFFVADASTSFGFGPGKMTVAVSNLLNNQYFGTAAQLSGNRPDRYVPSPGAIVRIGYVVKY